MSYNLIIEELENKKSKNKSEILSYFFKTGKGEYGEGDKFFGITVPESRLIAKKYLETKYSDIEKLLENKYHEARLIGLLILVHNFKKNKEDTKTRKQIYNFYLKNTKYINNWDLVDLSAHYIVGYFILDKDRTILIKLAKSKNLWERRIAIISTFAFIYEGEYEWTFKIVDMLMNDKHDLIHKACGWMLREVGKRISVSILIEFLDSYGSQMPRTMLRYAIERLPENQRKFYLKSTLTR